MNEEIKRLDAIIKKNKLYITLPKACLYSGGLDSATAHYYYGGDKYTIIWEDYPTKDDAFCKNPIFITRKMVAEHLSKIFQCFDRPIVETGIFPLYFAYKYLAERGYKYIVTGDGGDELFLGYKWDKLAYIKPKIIEAEIINHLYAKHIYIGNSLSKKFGVKIISPFTNKEIIRFAVNLPLRYKATLFNDKIILRKLMQDKIIVRPKYYFHNPIQEWFCITRKNKTKWFLEKWMQAKQS